MKNIARIILVTVFLLSTLSGSVFSSNTTDSPTSPEGILKASNEFMKEVYELKYDYFPNSTEEDGVYRQDLLQKQLDTGGNHFIIAYGKDHGEKLDYKGGMYEYVGFTKDHNNIPNEEAPWYAGWSGTQIQDFDLIKEPWKDHNVVAKYNITESYFDGYTNEKTPYLKDSNGTLEIAILKGLNDWYGGRKYKDGLMYHNKSSQYADLEVYTIDAKPKNGGDWTQYVHVLQPPTYYSWGFGVAYIKNASIGITYVDIPIAPFSMQENDLSAQFENLPSGVAVGQPVTVGIKLASSFQTDQTTDYEWDIKANGADVSAAYSGHATTSSGTITIPANDSRLLYATFPMPESDVTIAFHLNKTFKSPEEEVKENNQLESTIALVSSMPPTIGQFDLNYNVLNKEVRFPLADGQEIEAHLRLPSNSYWNGNAVGSLHVNNSAPTLYRNFQVLDNPPVNEPSEDITRKPIITTTLQRIDFGDDPLHHNWLNWSPPQTPKMRSGDIQFNGSVSRNYIKLVRVCNAKKCWTREVPGTATASFTPGEDTRTIHTYIYNGLPVVPVVPAKTYLNKIDHNQSDSLKKNLYWTSEPYRYDVIRWMANEDENGTLFQWAPVDGQYERIFTQQAEGTVTWSPKVSLAQEYKQARDTAKKMTNRKSLYDKAVFATDRELQKYDYPIKSGYYFNPTGSYTFTVETVTFKPTPDDTKDHKDMVDSVVNSFRYETDLMYINSRKEAVNLRNEPLPRKGNSYARKAAVLSVKDSKGVDGVPLVTVIDRSEDSSRYSKQVDEIEYSQDRGSDSHVFWKNILEGYSESGTLGSRSSFLYQEHVKNGQKMYKITEKTTVTININENNKNIYTHAHMPDGQYQVKAWINSINLAGSSNAYKVLGTLQGISTLDQIAVTVRGSLYDDINN